MNCAMCDLSLVGDRCPGCHMTLVEGALYDRFENAPRSLSDADFMTLAHVKVSICEYVNLDHAVFHMLLYRAGASGAIPRAMLAQFRTAAQTMVKAYAGAV